MGGDLAYDQEPNICLFGNSDSLGNALSRRHPTHHNKKILRSIVERNLIQLDSVIHHRQGFIPQHFGLRVADTNREATGKVDTIILVELFLDVRVSDQGGGV